ncbi:hypothetical protein FHS55_002171 [Angulomicrobium tetraedrale]|uniref:Uncharacterized protein n=1 Tax=Ancylobacter tetraedralis TaxID=217068 RepID=A0A839ZA17_9HYPH|nr:hypothetical protein [Ancylobacter tetraedralis]MBB3771572.1 hypothetical protein [Ancylobacter tetraedralis]
MLQIFRGHPLLEHGLRIATDGLDSNLASPRVYWRRRFGLSERLVNDPRRLGHIVDDVYATGEASSR